MEGPKLYSDKINRKDDEQEPGLEIPAGSYKLVDEHSIVKPLFEPHFKSLRHSGGEIRPKLEISQPEDEAEIQADEMAESFIHGDEEESKGILSKPVPEVSREGEGNATQTSEKFDQQLESTKGQGQKLDENIQLELEAHMGTDLSGVNIHTGPHAHEMSELIDAQAFTHEQDIYFKEGNYNPESEEGRKLLAHEVAHTVQQDEGVSAKIQRDEDEKSEIANNRIGFTVDISTYVPIAGDANIQHSADFALGQIFSISTEDAHTFINLGFVDDKTGYTADKVKEGSSNVFMSASTYFLILDRIKDVPKTLLTIQHLAAGFNKLHRTRSFSTTGHNYWNSYMSDLRQVYRLFAQLNSKDVEKVRQQYMSYFSKALDADFKETYDWFKSPPYQGAAYKKHKRNGTLLFNGLQLLLSGIEYKMPEDDVAGSDVKPAGVILMSPSAGVVSVGFEASYSIHIEKKNNITYEYDWYILYDTQYPSSQQGHITHISGTETLSYPWEAPGLNKLFCTVTQLSGKDEIAEDTYAALQYVYPNAKEFAKNQQKKEIANYQDPSISIDLLATSVQATQLRLMTAQRLIAMDKTDVSGAAGVLESYQEALKSVIIISEFIRSEKINAITPKGGFIPGQEPVWAKQDASWKNNVSADMLDQATVQNGMQGTQPNTLNIAIGKPIDDFSMTFFNFVAKNYTETFDVEVEPGVTSNWTVMKNGWTREDYDRLFNITWGIGNVKVPAELNSSNIGTWESVLQNFRIREGFLDDLIALEIIKRNPDNKELQTAALQLQSAGKMARNIANIYENHPDAIAIPAIFYPDSQQLTLKENRGEASPPVPDNYAAAGYRVFFYLYKEDGEWVLDDANPDSQGTNRVPITLGEIFSISKESATNLFEQVDSKKRFPKGNLYYKIPGTEIEGLVVTTTPKELSEWLREIGFIFMIAALPFALVGAAAIATTLVVVGAGIDIAGNVADMYEHNKQGLLDQRTIMLDGLAIATDIATIGLAGVGTVLNSTTKATMLAKLAGRLYIPLKSTQIVAGSMSMLITTADLYEQFKELDKIEDKDKRLFAMIRIIATGLAIASLHVISVKGDYDDIANAFSKGRNIYFKFDQYGNRKVMQMYNVDPPMKKLDIEEGIYSNNGYDVNKTATQNDNLINTQSNTIWINGKKANGEYMYVIDENDNIIMATRENGKVTRSPHPTLIGGTDPQVKAAGMVFIKKGRIFWVNNNSGHFKPGPETLDVADEIFHAKFPADSFDKNFKGFMSYDGN